MNTVGPCRECSQHCEARMRQLTIPKQFTDKTRQPIRTDPATHSECLVQTRSDWLVRSSFSQLPTFATRTTTSRNSSSYLAIWPTTHTYWFTTCLRLGTDADRINSSLVSTLML